MGAAYDYLLECERLQRQINNKNRKIREQKKLIAELAQGIVDSVDGVYYTGEKFDEFSKKEEKLYEKANKILNKNKKK